MVYGGRCLTALSNNISVISWRSVLLMEESEYMEKTTYLPQVTDIRYHIMLDRVGFELSTLLVIGTYCIDSLKSNFYTITTRMDPLLRCIINTQFLRSGTLPLSEKDNVQGVYSTNQICISAFNVNK